MRLRVKYKFLGLIIVNAIIFVFVALFILFLAKGLFDVKQEEGVEDVFDAIESNVLNEIDFFKHEILVVKNFSALENLLEASSVGDYTNYSLWESELQKAFQNLMLSHDSYMQIRYLDENGMELIRVDRESKDAAIQVVSGSGLQDKSDRYYFQESVGLADGEVFVSELDLNVENGEIVIPYQPVMRFATPVFHGGKNVGVIVVNIFGNEIVDALNDVPYANTALIDQDGYYLYNLYNSELEWSKSLGTEYTYPNFKDLEPTISAHFRSRNFYFSGFSDAADGLAKDFFYKIDYNEGQNDNFLILVSSINESDYYADFNSLSYKVVTAVSLFVIFMIFVFLVVIDFINKPISLLSKTLERLNVGDYYVETPVVSDDEFGDISRNMNILIKNVRERHEEVYRFITLASHQLRTPISAAKMQMDLLKEVVVASEGEEDGTKEMFVEIDANMKRSTSIVNSLLNYMEVGDKYFASNVQSVSLKQLIEDILLSEKSRIELLKLKVKVEVEKSLIFKVEVQRFKQALVILLANAIDYSNEGGVIEIKVSKREGGISFSIGDSGIGIPDDDQVHIFETFFRASNSSLKKGVGSGLNLLIAKKIIEGHGGRLQFKSTEGKGTVFWFDVFTS